MIFEHVDILQTSGRPIRATPVAPKRSQSSEASNWELLPLPNATDATGWRITVWSQSKNFNACKKLGVFQNSSNIVTAVPQGPYWVFTPSIYFTTIYFGEYSLWSFWRILPVLRPSGMPKPCSARKVTMGTRTGCTKEPYSTPIH